MHRHGEERSWWSRNWGWVIGCGCLIPLIGFAACTGLVWFGGKSWLESSGGFPEALERVRAHPEVVAALGEPIEMTFGNINTTIDGDDDGSTMRSTVPISGPNGSGRMRFEAIERGNAWELTELVVTLPGRSAPIDLLAETPPPSPGPE